MQDDPVFRRRFLFHEHLVLQLIFRQQRRRKLLEEGEAQASLRKLFQEIICQRLLMEIKAFFLRIIFQQRKPADRIRFMMLIVCFRNGLGKEAARLGIAHEISDGFENNIGPDDVLTPCLMHVVLEDFRPFGNVPAHEHRLQKDPFIQRISFHKEAFCALADADHVA